MHPRTTNRLGKSHLDRNKCILSLQNKRLDVILYDLRTASNQLYWLVIEMQYFRDLPPQVNILFHYEALICDNNPSFSSILLKITEFVDLLAAVFLKYTDCFSVKPANRLTFVVGVAKLQTDSSPLFRFVRFARSGVLSLLAGLL